MTNLFNAQGVHTPRKFKQQALDTFLSRDNIRYLSIICKQDVTASVLNWKQTASDLLDDPSVLDARKNRTREVKRLNYEFVRYFMSKQFRDTGGRESYQMQMFSADSLGPAGLESINDRKIPKHLPPMPAGIQKQTYNKPYWLPAPVATAAPRRSSFTDFPRGGDISRHFSSSDANERALTRDFAHGFMPTPLNPKLQSYDLRGNIGPNFSQMGDEDDPWDNGDPYRTVDDRQAEYLNSDQTYIYGDRNGERPRYMRYEEFPFWQRPRTGEGLDRTQEGNLCQMRGEYENPVFGWGSAGYQVD